MAAEQGTAAEPEVAAASLLGKMSLQPAEQESLDVLLQAINRDINCLGDDNRATRKRSLKKLTRELSKDGLSASVLQEAMSRLLKPLLKTFVDPVESCREQAVDLMSSLLARVASPTEALPYLIPILVARLGQKDITEETEEIRKQLVGQVAVILDTCPSSAGVYIDELVQILTRTVVDPFPDVKKDSCEVVVRLAATCPERFHMAASGLVKPLIATSKHQHSRVRVAAVKAIGSAVQHGPSDLLEEVRTIMAQRTMDDSPSVRKALYGVATNWLLHHKDRYSYWYKLLPLLLSGESDPVPEIQTMCKEGFHKVGKTYEDENEEKMKEELDFGTHYEGRPGLGCRALVKESFSKIYPGIIGELADWNVSNRRQSASLLLRLLFYAEDNVTMHLKKLMDGMYRAVQDEELDIGETVVKCFQSVGRYVEPAAWLEIILADLTAQGVQPRQRAAQVAAAAALIRGASRAAMVEHIPALVAAMTGEGVVQSETLEVQEEALAGLRDLIDRLFEGILSVLALTPALHAEVATDLELLAQATERDGVQSLYDDYTRGLLAKLQTGCDAWTKHSFERRLFEVILARAGTALGALLDDLMVIFVANVKVQRDVEQRASFFTLLARLLSDAKASLDSQGKLAGFSVKLLRDVMLPNVIWVAGRANAALRTTTWSCIWAMFRHQLVDKAQVADVVDQILPQIVSNMEDDFEQTRLVCCCVLEALLRLYPEGFQGGFENYNRLHKLYPELLKRMDDNSDDVRQVAIKDDYDRDLYQAHLEMIYKGLLVHLDDPSPAISQPMLELLCQAAKPHPDMLVRMAEGVRHRQRNGELCDKVIAAARALIA